MNFPWRLAAIDLDDTLLGPDKKISKENAAAVREIRHAGATIVLASGRRYENMLRFANELGLSGPIITVQGAAALQLGTREVLYKRYLQPEHVAVIITEGLRRGLTMLAYCDAGTYASRKDHLTDLYDRRSGDNLVVERDFKELTEPVMKIIWLDSPENIPALARWAAANLPFVHSVATDPEYLELMNLETNKAEALKAVAAHLGIDRKDVIAFGDGNNDAQMLEWAGLGVAVCHGSAIAKASADVTGPFCPREVALAEAVSMVTALP